MKITIVCAGKVKEKYLAEGIADFKKRLAHYCRLSFCEVPEEKMPDDPSPAEKEKILAKETEKTIAAVPEGSCLILLDLKGEEMTSEGLVNAIGNLALNGKSSITFAIGGTFGYTDALREKADLRLSFFKMTFTHQMIRLILLEQVYRAFKIMRGEKYHWRKGCFYENFKNFIGTGTGHGLFLRRLRVRKQGTPGACGARSSLKGGKKRSLSQNILTSLSRRRAPTRARNMCPRTLLNIRSCRRTI